MSLFQLALGQAPLKCAVRKHLTRKCVKEQMVIRYNFLDIRLKNGAKYNPSDILEARVQPRAFAPLQIKSA